MSGLSNHVDYLRLFGNNFAAAVGIVIACTEDLYMNVMCVCVYIYIYIFIYDTVPRYICMYSLIVQVRYEGTSLAANMSYLNRDV